VAHPSPPVVLGETASRDPASCSPRANRSSSRLSELWRPRPTGTWSRVWLACSNQDWG